MFKQVDYVMVTVSDMSRSIEFYRDKLGFPLKFESKDWTEFQTGPTTLALHGGGIPRPASPGGSPEQPCAGTCSIGFTVQDVEQSFNELKAKGVRFVLPPMVRGEEGIKLTVCIDPDGLPISLAEALQQAAAAS
jgi:catechol 2,3-dioxygenase-like lactoylglutathione lyase family enzyme